MLKAPVFEIKRFAVHDGDGIRTTVFLKGCPLRCVWCHNPEGLGVKPQLAYYSNKCLSCGECITVCPAGAHSIADGIHQFDRARCLACGKCAEVCLGDALTLYGRDMTADELLPRLLEDRDFYKNSGGGVTLSGGECLTHADFCAELLRRLQSEGIRTAVDTCGDVPKEAIDRVIPYTDIFLYDLKAVDEEVHKHCTGRSNRRILENLQYIDACGRDIEIRIPYVPGYNDGEINAMTTLLRELTHLKKVRLLAYHNYAGSKYASLEMSSTLPDRLPTEEELDAALAILTDCGLNTIR